VTTHGADMDARDDLIETPAGTVAEIRGRASGLHFAKEALTPGERRILADLEAVLGLLDSLTVRGYLHGYQAELPSWPTDPEPSAAASAQERPKPGGDAFVQAIVVGPGGTHLEVIDAVMRASVTSYLDRDLEDPAWHEWLAGSFTKTVRATNASKLDALRALAGTTTVTVGDATAVAWAPMRRDDLPRLVARARVSGLDRARPGPEQIPHLAGHSVLVNDTVPMSTGKAAAQAAHALMVRSLSGEWGATHVAQAKVVPVSQSLFDVFAGAAPDGVIRDAGWTEIPAGTATALAVEIDPGTPGRLLPPDPSD
jgi:peptidyl-tRNA hydrolase